MLQVMPVDLENKAEVKRFIRLPLRLYAGSGQWVPPIEMDLRLQLNPRKHPYYEHSEAVFFLAVQDGQDVGRICVLENRRYNEYHGERTAYFYHFECVEDQAVALALFDRAFEWARQRGLDKIIGPKGMGVFDGMGMLVEGFEHRAAMTMMLYNPPYYPRFAEAAGFQKEVDFVSCYLSAEDFTLPERVHRIADKVKERGNLRVVTFPSKRELRAIAPKLGKTYNDAFVDNWEYVPITDRELDMVIDDLLTVADPKLIKVIMHDDDVVGFLFAFPDLSAAIQRSRGRLFPLGFIDLLLEYRRTRWVILNGAGILPQYHGRGGNALLYSEMEKTVKAAGFQHADLAQVAETAVQMRRDLENLGGKPYKTHRVYGRRL
jgi:GNAT superfamily N-acetyltransferase